MSNAALSFFAFEIYQEPSIYDTLWGIYEWTWNASTSDFFVISERGENRTVIREFSGCFVALFVHGIRSNYTKRWLVMCSTIFSILEKNPSTICGIVIDRIRSAFVWNDSVREIAILTLGRCCVNLQNKNSVRFLRNANVKLILAINSEYPEPYIFSNCINCGVNKIKSWSCCGLNGKKNNFVADFFYKVSYVVIANECANFKIFIKHCSLIQKINYIPPSIISLWPSCTNLDRIDGVPI